MKREEINKVRGMLNAENEMLEKTLIEAVHGGGDVSGIVSIINENDAKLDNLNEEIADEDVEYVCENEDINEYIVCATPLVVIPRFGERSYKFIDGCHVRRTAKTMYISIYNFVDDDRKPVSSILNLLHESGDEFEVTVENRNMYGDFLFAEKFVGCQVKETPSGCYVGNENDGRERARLLLTAVVTYKSSEILY